MNTKDKEYLIKQGKLMRHNRIKLKMSQKQFAEKVSVNVRTVKRWENGKTDLYPYHRNNVCNCLNISSEEWDQAVMDFNENGTINKKDNLFSVKEDVLKYTIAMTEESTEKSDSTDYDVIITEDNTIEENANQTIQNKKCINKKLIYYKVDAFFETHLHNRCSIIYSAFLAYSVYYGFWVIFWRLNNLFEFAFASSWPLIPALILIYIVKNAERIVEWKYIKLATFTIVVVGATVSICADFEAPIYYYLVSFGISFGFLFLWELLYKFTKKFVFI